MKYSLLIIVAFCAIKANANSYGECFQAIAGRPASAATAWNWNKSVKDEIRAAKRKCDIMMVATEYQQCYKGLLGPLAKCNGVGDNELQKFVTEVTGFAEYRSVPHAPTTLITKDEAQLPPGNKKLNPGAAGQ